MGVMKLYGKKAEGAPKRIRIRKGDTVKVITGDGRGKIGRVVEVDRVRGRVTLESIKNDTAKDASEKAKSGINMVKKHVKANPARQIKGGIMEMEASMHVSNVMLLNSEGNVTRIRSSEAKAGAKVKRSRVAVKGGEVLDGR
jgi:large subunit ribosomal protein L24